MKRHISLFLALMMVFTMLISMGCPAFADDLINEVKGGNDNQSSSGTPSANDILNVCSSNDIQFPKNTSYFDNYAIMYVDAPKKLNAFVYKAPRSDAKKLENAYQGSKLVLLAEENGFYCVLYTTQKNQRTAGWISGNCVSSVYPGYYYTVGKQSWLSGYTNCGDAYTRWSNDYFVGTKVAYTIIDSLPCNLCDCRGMTIEYKITGRGTNDDLNREVYINYGDGWESVLTFTLDKSLSPVRVNLCFDGPVSVKGVAIIPTNPQNYNFSFRQTVVDVFA